MSAFKSRQRFLCLNLNAVKPAPASGFPRQLELDLGGFLRSGLCLEVGLFLKLRTKEAGDQNCRKTCPASY